MKEITCKGSSIDLATDEALKQLGASRDEVAVEPISAGSSGFLGLFGGKPAVVRVSLRPDEKIQALVFMRNILRMMSVESEMDVQKVDGEVLITLGESASSLIGSRGQTLDSLQYLVSRFLSGDKDRDDFSKVVIDIDNYRDKREDDLKDMALRMAEQVASTKRDMRTDPLTAPERRIVHMTLKENPDVTTFSIGDGSRKRIVIATTDKDAQRARRNDSRSGSGERRSSGGRSGGRSSGGRSSSNRSGGRPSNNGGNSGGEGERKGGNSGNSRGSRGGSGRRRGGSGRGRRPQGSGGSEGGGAPQGNSGGGDS
ncbi:MAG: RNA-binding cell elongation regulator Jag/EloR [Candidatus Hinthialibacter antarcticus]|nr:RNA-binding cell elongation regulator Jag/EloR [Candidatus Hinthialibacter antarcticus]